MEISNMFTMLDNMQSQSIRLIEPSVIRYSDNTGCHYLNISKDVEKEIYSRLGISKSVSNKIFDISSSIWNDLITVCSTRNEDYPFDFNNYNFLFYNSNLISIIKKSIDIESYISKFVDLLDSLAINYTHNCDILKAVLDLGCYKDSPDNKIIAIIELNFKKNYYKVIPGIKYNNQLLISSPVILEYDFVSFITKDIEYEVIMAGKTIPYMNLENISRDIKLSLREILDILKLSDIKLYEGNDYKIRANIMLSQDLENYFDNSGQTLKSLKSLSYLNKSLKFSESISINNMLDYLSDLYINYPDITISGLDNLRSIYSSSSDFKTIKESRDIKRLID